MSDQDISSLAQEIINVPDESIPLNLAIKCINKTKNSDGSINADDARDLTHFTYIFINEPGMEGKEDEFINQMIQTKKSNPGMSLEDVKSMVVANFMNSRGSMGGKSRKSKKSKKSRKSKKSKKSRKQRRTRRY
jgi:hypothetical protein